MEKSTESKPNGCMLGSRSFSFVFLRFLSNQTEQPTPREERLFWISETCDFRFKCKLVFPFYWSFTWCWSCVLVLFYNFLLFFLFASMSFCTLIPWGVSMNMSRHRGLGFIYGYGKTLRWVWVCVGSGTNCRGLNTELSNNFLIVSLVNVYNLVILVRFFTSMKRVNSRLGLNIGEDKG